MPTVDFSNISDPAQSNLVPEGWQPCVIRDIDVRTTRNNDPLWALRFEVESGPHEGRAIWDNLVFSKAALPRLKSFCFAIGLDVSGEVDLTPDMIRGKSCRVLVKHEEYEGRQYISVAYDGFAPPEGVEDLDVPF